MMCETSDDDIKIRLWEIDQIKTADNQWVYVKDAEVGSAFLLKDDSNNDVKVTLSSKEPVDLDFILTFRKED